MSLQTSTRYVVLDISKSKYVVVQVKQYDKNVREIIAKVTDNGKPYPLDNSIIPRIKCKKDDGTYVVNDCVVLDDGDVKIDISDQMTACAGTHDCELALFDSVEDRVLHTMNFILSVKDAVFSDDEVTSSNEFIALENALLKVEKLDAALEEHVADADEMLADTNETIASANTMIDDLENTIETIDNNEAQRESAENQRNANENTRKQNEQLRDEAEAIRKANESKRNSAENERIEAEEIRQSNEEKRQAGYIEMQESITDMQSSLTETNQSLMELGSSGQITSSVTLTVVPGDIVMVNSYSSGGGCWILGIYSTSQYMRTGVAGLESSNATGSISLSNGTLTLTLTKLPAYSTMHYIHWHIGI